MAAKKELTVAFIGAGGIAGAYLSAMKQIPAMRVVGFADVSEKALAQRAQQVDLDRSSTFTDYREMLATIKPDSVVVCTPNALHAPASIAASEAGAHVIVEKPMAMNAQQCRQMIAAAKKADRKLVIGFQMRFDPRTRFLCDVRDKGFFGDMLFGRVWSMRRRGIPNWGVFGRKDLQGGGPMIDIGVHALEMCHYTMGSPKPVAATGMTSTYIGNKPSNRVASSWSGWDHKTYTVEDLAIGSIRFENGSVIHIESSFAAHIDSNMGMDFQIMGTQGGARWEKSELYHDQWGYMVDSKPGWIPALGSFDNYFIWKLQDFYDHVVRDKPSSAPAEHGLMVQQMLDGVYGSAAQGGKEFLIK